MNTLTYRYFAGGILSLWGTVLCFIYATGRISSYLHPTFHPLVIYCGCVLFLLALIVVLAPAGSSIGCASPSPTSWTGLIGMLILIVPVLVALSATRDSFGNTTVHNRTFVEDISQLPNAPAPMPVSAPVEPPLPGDPPSSDTQAPPPIPTTPDGAIVAEVTDLLYAAQDPEIRKTFENKKVQLIGQMVPAKTDNPNHDRYDVVRLFMTCCAADARPVAVTFHPSVDPKLSEMSWVKVTGKATFSNVGGQLRPLIEDATAIVTDPPDDTFIY